MKRILSALLAVSLACSLMATTALAEVALPAQGTANLPASNTIPYDEFGNPIPVQAADPVAEPAPEPEPSPAPEQPADDLTQPPVEPEQPAEQVVIPAAGEPISQPAPIPEVQPRVIGYAVSYQTQGQGTLSIDGADYSGSGSYAADLAEGTALNLSATPAAGWTLDALVVNNQAFSGGAYTVMGETSIRAIFTEDAVSNAVDSFTLSIPVYANGSIAVSRSGSPLSDGDTVNAGDTLVITATAAAGYQTGSLSVGGDAVTSGGSYTVGGADSYFGAGTLTVTAGFTVDTLNYAVAYTDAPGGQLVVTSPDGRINFSGQVQAGETITIEPVAESDYTLENLTVNGQSYAEDDLTNGALTLTVNEAVTASATFASSVSPIITTYYEITLPTVANATVTATVSNSTPFYTDATGATSSGTTLAEGATKYVAENTVVTILVQTDSRSYWIDDITNTAGGGVDLAIDVNSTTKSLPVTVTTAVTLGVTITSAPSTSSTGDVYAPIAVQDEDGESLEDIDGRVFDISALSSDGRLVLDGIAPGQTFYIKLGENGYDPFSTLSDGTNTATASDLVNEDLFKLSIDKDGTGKSLISSITRVEEKNLDGVRGSYLKVVLKDSTTTDELKASAELTFTAKKTLAANEDGNTGSWEKGDETVLQILMWVNNSEATDSAETGDRIYIDPEANEENTFVWDDDRAALEFYADDSAEAFYARLSTKSQVDIYTEYGDPVDAELWFYDFVGNPSVPSTSRASLTLGVPWDEDEELYDPESVYLYELSSDGTLTDVTDRFLYSEDDYEIPGWTIKTRVMGTYVVSDTELDLDSGYEVDYDEEEEETEDTSYEELNRLNPVTGGGDYYYTPVAEPANYSVTGTAPTQTTAKSAAQDELTQMRSVAVAEAVPEIVSTQTDAATRGSIPVVGIVVTLLALAGAGTAGWLVYRKLSEES